MRRGPLAYREATVKELKRMESVDVLENIASSPWVSNMGLQWKDKGRGELRICGDLRNPNKAIISDLYPLPSVDELIDHFAGAKYFNKIELKLGYLHVYLSGSARDLTAMITPLGLTREEVAFCPEFCTKLFPENNRYDTPSYSRNQEPPR